MMLILHGISVDGIGGAVNYVVWKVVRSRNDCVNSAASFITAANTCNVKDIEVKPCNIKSITEELVLDEAFREATLIPGIAQVHCMKQEMGKSMHFMLTIDRSTATWDENVCSFSVGDWCAVDYGVLYPGEMKSIVCGKYQVSAMVPAGTHWKWPNCPNEIFYPQKKC